MLSGLLCSFAYAQDNPVTSNPKTLKMTIPCDNFQTVFDIMIKNKESLLWTANSFIQETSTGQNYPGSIYVWANLDTQSVSLTIMFGDGVMCLLAPGNSFTPYSGKQPWEKLSEKKYIP